MSFLWRVSNASIWGESASALHPIPVLGGLDHPLG
jgi:hypothetical protein